MKKQILAICILILATGILYNNIFKNDFVIDDNLFIVNWPLIKDFNNFGQFFGAHNQPIGEEGVYSPLKTLFHSISYHAWGTNPFGYHLVALLIHLFGVILIYKITASLVAGSFLPFLTALIFAINPVQVEAITFLTASVDSLGVVFLFASFYFYIKSVDIDNLKNKLYIQSLLFAFLAIFTHELTIILPLILMLYEGILRKNLTNKKTIVKIIPFLTISLCYVLVKYLVLGQVNRGGYLYDSFYLTMLVIIQALAKYFLVFFMPLKLSVNQMISPGIYSVDSQYFDKTAVFSQSIFNIQVLLSVSFIGLIIFLAFKLYKIKPIIAFFIGWIFICLLPVMNVIPTGCYFAERYLYSASFGLSFILSTFLFDITKQFTPLFNKKLSKAIGILLTATIVLFYSFRTYARNRDWQNEVTFYMSEVETNPENYSMQRSLGVVLLRHNMPDKALFFLKEAVRLNSQDADNQFALAEAYSELNNLTGAVKHYNEAIKIKSDFPEAYYNLAGIYAFLGDEKKAKDHFEKAISLYKRQNRLKDAEQAKKVFEKYFINNFKEK